MAMWAYPVPVVVMSTGAITTARCVVVSKLSTWNASLSVVAVKTPAARKSRPPPTARYGPQAGRENERVRRLIGSTSSMAHRLSGTVDPTTQILPAAETTCWGTNAEPNVTVRTEWRAPAPPTVAVFAGAALLPEPNERRRPRTRPETSTTIITAPQT